MDAIVGASGFVGGSIARQRPEARGFTSRDSREAMGPTWDRVWFAAARAEKWRINKDPATDAAHIAELIRLVEGIRAERFVLISTVDVYGTPAGVDESTPIETTGLHPYGLHRYELERAVRRAHPTALIVRLPGLYGRGLKKNIVYDLLHDNGVDRINPDSEFQYYGVESIAADLDRALELGLDLLNLTSAPVSTGRLATECFGVELPALPDASAIRYDMRTLHPEVLGGPAPYGRSADEVVAGIRAFVERTRASG